MTPSAFPIQQLTPSSYRFPTPAPEADGTLEWEATIAVAVHVTAGGETGLGWTYSSRAAVDVIGEHLSGALHGRDAFDIDGAWSAMHRACRNFGTKGIVMQAISAVDIALWDLKARLIDQPLTNLLGSARTAVPIYGSGGFTSNDDDELADQIAGWTSDGCTAMKIKIAEGWGSHVERDLSRVRRLRQLAGDHVAVMVDANGGYHRGQARRIGHALDELGVVWFEEPVSSDDIDGLAAVRAVVDCDVAAGEYAADGYDAARLAPAVDCLQLDATRCGGYTGWRRAAGIAAAHNLEISAHCAPALHTPVAASVANLRHVEYFLDHARLEPLLVDGTPDVRNGALHPNDAKPGHGMTLSERASEYLAK